MKRNLLRKSGIGLLILAGTSFGFMTSAHSASSDEGGIYDDVGALQHSLQDSSFRAERGAEGPIRSVDVQPKGIDVYDSVSKYQAAQQWEMTATERGAQGPIRSEADMAMDRNRDEWKKMVDIFTGTD